ncbi:DUF6531 domain-containing protein [Butyrivibrio sp. INlla21]|uniref:DUF6531 domain-containing protein n=1 Tax=Butyrivibrio sp. INlla21 TaxID=1520811 RepID=UPI0008DEBD59|nr:DUF6531 domain-containing protein [Butyrivibrio sp. INlla21]SFU67407.1 RHS repeat-associated core domain-containing protein [Butyrivibrio sp. INlla21]
MGKRYDAKKIADFIDELEAVIGDYNRKAEQQGFAYNRYVENQTYVGKAAEASKYFISIKQSGFQKDLHALQRRMVKLYFEVDQLFKAVVDISAKAKIDTDILRDIKKIFRKYEMSFRPKSIEIEEKAADLQDKFCEYGSFTQPSYKAARLLSEELCGDGEFIDTVIKNFREFDEESCAYIDSTGFEQYVVDFLTEVSKTAGALGKMKVYDPKMEDIYLNLVTTGAAKTLQNINLNFNNYKDNIQLSALAGFKRFMMGCNFNCQSFFSDPVNVNNGNYINDREDLVIQGLYPLTIRRFYNAQSDRSGLFGKGWTSLFDMHISKDKNDDSTIVLFFSDGHEGRYQKVSDDTKDSDISDDGYDIEDNENIEIVRCYDGRCFTREEYESKKIEYVEEHGELGELFEYPDRYKLVKDDGSYTEFDKAGNVLAFGNQVNELARIDRLDDGLCRIVSGNKYIEITINENGYVTGAKDNTGRSVKYEYVSRDADTLLNVVAYPDGTTRKYNYDKNGIINEVTNPQGVIFLKNEIDDAKRVTKQEFPDGGVVTFKYDEANRTTTVTEQNGLVTEYLNDEFGRHIGTRYPEQGISETFTYNDKNQKTAVTDKKGNITRFSYDNRGHLTKVIDANGNITNITYNAQGKPIVVKTPGGAVYKYTYDECGQLISSINPLLEENRFLYNSYGQIDRIINPEGESTFLRYDKNRDICYIKDEKGLETFYERDDLGRIISTRNALGAKTIYEYDSMDRIIKTIDPMGFETRYSYNKNGKLIRVENPDNTSKTWDYNDIGKTSEYTDEAGRITKISYNKVWDEEEVTLPNGGKITYEYDLLKRLIKVTDPEHREVSYDYDANDNVIAQYNGDIKVRSLTYDGVGNITSETDALGNTKTYEYDENRNLIAVTDALGNRYTREVDFLGRVVKEIDPLGNTTSYAYTKLGDIESITDAAGRVRRFEHENGRLSAIYFCDKLEQRLRYDFAGRVIKRRFSDGYTISYEYDLGDHILNVTASDGRNISYEYDAMGRATKVTDGTSTTLYTYTPSGRLKSVVDALGNETAYTYDALDNLKSIHRAEGLISEEERKGDIFPTVGKDGHVTIYDYDLSGQLTMLTDALGYTEAFEYDHYGRLIKKTDKDNYKTTYTYDLDNRVNSINYADGRSVELSYNALGKLTKFTDWLGITEIARDVIGRAISVTDYNGKKVSYTYGKVNERSSITYPSGEKVDYIYDNKRRLSELISGDKKTSYFYDEFDRLIEKRLPNSNREIMDYIPGGLLKSLEMHDDNGLLDKYIYNYDAQGNRTGIDRSRRNFSEMSGTYTYGYDLEKRLTSVSLNGSLLRSYNYDAFGNRSRMTEDGNITTYSYDELDRLYKEVSPFEHKLYTYDNRGNISQSIVNDVVEKTFIYDATNMLVKVTDSIKGEALYSYNGIGKRVSAINPTENIEYMLDLTREYHNLLERSVNDQVEIYTYDDNVISMSKHDNDYYYMLDELGTGMYLTGTDGSVLSAFAYDEFGRSLNPSTGKRHRESYSKQGNIIHPFAFTGYQYDEIADGYYAQARYYDANTGRFASRDSYMFTDISNPESLNLYEYCYNSPIELYDPTGNIPWWVRVFGKGIEAHTFLEGYAVANIPNAKAEFVIHGEVPLEDRNGMQSIWRKADILIANPDQNLAEIYEIKPSTYDPNSKYYEEHPELKALGKIKNAMAKGQLAQYVLMWDTDDRNSFSTGCEYANQGINYDEKFNDVYIESVLNPGQYIHYYTGTGKNQGLVFYEYTKDTNGRRIEVPSCSKEKIEERYKEHIYSGVKQVGKAVLATAGVLGLLLAGGAVAAALGEAAIALAPILIEYASKFANQLGALSLGTNLMGVLNVNENCGG